MNTKSAAFPMLVLIVAPIAIFFLVLECLQPVIDYTKGTPAFLNVYCKYHDVRYRVLQTPYRIIFRNYKFKLIGLLARYLTK